MASKREEHEAAYRKEQKRLHAAYNDEKHHKFEEATITMNEIEKRASNALYRNQGYVQHWENNMDLNLKAAADASRRNARFDEHSLLALEVQKLKLKEEAELRYKQLLRTNDGDLKDLERKLRSCYTKKQLCNQIAEQESLKEEAKHQKDYESAAMEAANKAYTYEEEVKQKHYEEQKRLYRKELIEAIREKRSSQLQEKQEETVACREQVNIVVAEMQSEEQRKSIQRLEKMYKEREDLAMAAKLRAEWLIRQKEEEIKEERRNLHYKMQYEEHERMINEEKEQQRKLREKTANELGIANLSKQHEREDILKLEQCLMEEEAEQKVLDSLKEDQIKAQERLRLHKIDSQINRYMVSYRNQQEVEQNKRDRETALRSIVEDNHRQIAECERQHDKKKQYRIILEKELDEKRVNKAKEHEDRQREYEREKQLELQRHAEIEMERRAILEEHIPNLAGYIPEGYLYEAERKNVCSEEKKDFRHVASTLFY